MSPDAINALMEIGGGFVTLLNVRQILRDREVRGLHWSPVVFFALWSWWNLYYYWGLEQYCSWVGSLLLACSNTWWLFLVLYYWRARG